MGLLANCLAHGRFFTRCVRDFMRTLFPLPHTLRRRIPAEACRDLVWWLNFLPSFNGIFSICPPPPELMVYTGASGKLGVGGYWDDVFFSERCPKAKMALPIHWKEMGCLACGADMARALAGIRGCPAY